MLGLLPLGSGSPPGARATKNPSCREASEGSASGGVHGSWWRTRSADALSKYENSGAHGTDPLPDALSLSSRWDARLIM
ncbi:hypothetical protein B7R87_24565 [Streptomyces tsukubensis]|uniref:Uncharacterized protein n=1 Tax=Streptomyces tsukubensis (strain DSM 42081 / NBRC 108919 / NRRL 18488 / 9993) TaxID=1114943 RepID=A0A7G3UBH2_STRT9|nr:hypothetical protein B7R87_24565 [Streptomyces tsukubensis]QKM67318.1 hypothetical protein STSU_009195 [Streptomyces tsukubensis NRRL18488]TAI42022.1 hypothetical protein EWI31_24055 [Streptomyces tsukubensis]